MQKNAVIVFMLIFSPGVIFAQHTELSGRVVDAEGGTPLVGVNIQILGTTRGASSDLQGRYHIERAPVGRFTVRASMIGYRAKLFKEVRLRVGQNNRLDIELVATPIEFDPIVVLGGKSKQRLDQAPVSISVITAKEIEQRNPVDLIEALETMPGVHFVGNQINIRGSTGYTFGAGNKVLLLLDGVPVYASDTGEFNWDMLSPFDVEQIEILKGAGSTLWGASALGGVVNIITKDPSPEGKLGFAYSVGRYDDPFYPEWYWTNHERLHFTREDVSYSKRIGSLGLRLSASRFMSTGYRELGDAQKIALTGKIDYRFGDVLWNNYIAYSKIDRGFFLQWKSQNDPYEVDPRNLENEADINQLNFYTKVTIPFSAKFSIQFRGSFVRTLMGNQFSSSADFNPAIGQGIEVQFDYLPVLQHHFTGGVQFQYDAGSAKFFGDHKGYFIGPYLQDEWQIRDNLRLTAGFRYDRYQLIDGLKEDLFSPRLGINWQPRSATTVRGSVGSGFRAATIVERFFEYNVMNFKVLSNPDLKAESSWAYDIGFRHYFTESLNIDVSLFDNEYRELIEAHMDLIRGQIQFRNVPRARIRGVELSLNTSFPVRFLGVDLQASMTAMDHENLRSSEPLPYRPEMIASLKGTLRIKNVQWQLDYRYASRIEAVKVYPINERVPMKIIDTRLLYRYSRFAFHFAVNNLLQYNYAPMESNLLPMRHFVLGVKAEF
jgi:iron complex outermembrane receptor protein